MRKLMAVVFAAIGLSASAVTVNVYPDGSSTPTAYDSLSAAAAAAGAGATVELTGDVELTEKITLNKGTDAKPVVIRSAEGSVFKIRRTALAGAFDLQNVRFESVTIDGGADWTHPFDECTSEAEFMACTGVDSTDTGNRVADLMKVSGTVTLGAGASLTNAISRQYESWQQSSGGTAIYLTGNFVVEAGGRISDVRGAKLVLIMSDDKSFTLDGGVIEHVYIWSGYGRHSLFQQANGDYIALNLKGGTICGCRSGTANSGPLDFADAGKLWEKNVIALGGGATPLVLDDNRNIDGTAHGLRFDPRVTFKAVGSLAAGSDFSYEYKTAPASLDDEPFGLADVAMPNMNVCAISCANDPRYRARLQGGNLVWQRLEVSPAAAIGDMTTRTLTYYGSLTDAFAACPDGQTVYLLADAANAAMTLKGRSLTLDLNGFTLSGDPITVGDGASLKVTGSTASCGFVVNGADASLALSQGTVGDVTVTRGSFEVDYSTGGALTAAAGTKVRLGFGTTFASKDLDDDADVDDYLDPCEGEGNAVRFSKDGGETWTEYATLDEVLTFLKNERPKDTDVCEYVLELLRNCTWSKSDFVIWDRHGDLHLVIRSDSRGSKRYVMKRTAADAKFYWRTDSNYIKGHTMAACFENIILDGGAIWTNPIDPAADEATNLASTGVGAGPMIAAERGGTVELGKGCVVRNIKGGNAIYTEDSGATSHFHILDGALITGVRVTGSNVAGLSMAAGDFEMSGGVIENCFAGGDCAILNMYGTSRMSGGVIRNTVSFGTCVKGKGWATQYFTGGTIENNKIAGTKSSSTGSASYGVVGIPNVDADTIHFSGAPVIRNNVRIGDGSPAGVWLGGRDHILAIDGPLDPGAWIEIGRQNVAVGEGNALGNQTVDATASGFERFGAVQNPVNGKYYVLGKNGENKVIYTEARLIVNAGIMQQLTGDLGTGIYVFNFDEWLNAGRAKVTGTVTWDADTVLSLGVSRAALQAVKSADNIVIPLLTATAINGFDTFLAAKGEALELPKNWELRKVTLASGEEQVQLYRKGLGLMLILR